MSLADDAVKGIRPVEMTSEPPIERVWTPPSWQMEAMTLRQIALRDHAALVERYTPRYLVEGIADFEIAVPRHVIDLGLSVSRLELVSHDHLTNSILYRWVPEERA